MGHQGLPEDDDGDDDNGDDDDGDDEFVRKQCVEKFKR